VLNKKDHIFFCGIGGIGMSGLAKILLENGYKVSGSDLTKPSIVDSLISLGATFYLSQIESNLAGADVFVYSAAIPKDNPEFLEAKKRNLKMISRSELLGDLMKSKKGIAVAGTHGKTTTSTMLSMVLEEAGLDPTIVVGGEVGNIGGNAKTGRGEYFVAEACEYEKSFLDIHPFGAIITNIEADHLDTYKDLDDIIETFKKFATQIDKNGVLVVCGDDKNMMHLNGSFDGHLITYGLKDADFIAEDIKVTGRKTIFSVKNKDRLLGQFELIIPGIHNVLDALSVIAICDHLGLDLESVRLSISKFVNAKRRYEIKGEKNGVLVIDDYAHHPTEIRATLKGIADFYPDKKIWAVFQPHQYSRTRLLFDDFSESFKGIHKVIIPDIYEARDTEDDKKAVTAEKLAEAIDSFSKNGIYIGDFEEATDYLSKNVESGDLIITIGAGPVYRVAEGFLNLK
jgi:UDP-N-acetylmuramate--alanine ligase